MWMRAEVRKSVSHICLTSKMFLYLARFKFSIIFSSNSTSFCLFYSMSLTRIFSGNFKNLNILSLASHLHTPIKDWSNTVYLLLLEVPAEDKGLQVLEEALLHPGLGKHEE
jgi:hypothetical protein